MSSDEATREQELEHVFYAARDEAAGIQAVANHVRAERAAEYDELRALVEWDVANDPYDTDHLKRWLAEHPRGDGEDV